MNNISDIERNLNDAEHQQGLYSDNERIIANQITVLRQRLNQVNQEEQQEMTRLRQPLERTEGDLDTEKKTLERAHDKFAAAQAEYKKIEDRYKQFEAEYLKDRNDARRRTDVVVKQFQTERRKIETAIEQKEREEAQARANRINAERTTTLMRKRLEDARRQELDQLQRRTANSNHAPRGAHYGTYR